MGDLSGSKARTPKESGPAFIAHRRHIEKTGPRARYRKRRMKALPLGLCAG
jgi:hypothetical protein